MKWHTMAHNMAAELEKALGSPYTINVVEEMARNKMVSMVHEKREVERKRLFDETVQVCLLVSLLFLSSLKGQFEFFRSRSR